MLDLYTIPDLFSSVDLTEDYEGYRFGKEAFTLACCPLRDPHDEADAWLGASSEAERAKVQAKAEARHKLLQAELARSIRTVTREEYLDRKRQDMARWRKGNPTAHKARQKAWREANREYTRQHMKTYRAKLKQDPERYAEELERTKLRMRALRAAQKAKGIPRKKPTPEQAVKLRGYRKTYNDKKKAEQK